MVLYFLETMNYYETLGLNRGASSDEIKKAYRSMAMKHHPDRGGNEKNFKEIEEAYRTLSDPQKKQMVDSGMDPNQNGRGNWQQGSPFEFHFNTGNFDDVFGQFGFGFGGRSRPRNRSFNVNVIITLEEALTGKEVNAEIGLPNGQKKMVSIGIPQGIEHGQQIRYQGMGDNTIKDAPAGDLIVNVIIEHHARFQRSGDQLIYNHSIAAWDAILGTTLKLETLDKKVIDIIIPPGTQPETTFSCRNEGMPNVRNKRRGNLLIKISIEIPRNLNQAQRDLIRQIKNGI
jgi:curved DNA-binding protein